MINVIDLFMSVYQGCLFIYTLKKQFIQRAHSVYLEIICVSLMVLYLSFTQYLQIPLSDNLIFIFFLGYIKLTTNERLITCALWVTLDAFLFTGTLVLVSSMFDIQINVNGSVLFATEETKIVYGIIGNTALTIVLTFISRINKVKQLISQRGEALFLLLLLLNFVIDECFFASRIADTSQNTLVIGPICSFLSMILLMILYEFMKESALKQKQAELLAQTTQLVSDHQDELKSIYKTLLAEQHDLKHRVIAAEEILLSTSMPDEQRSQTLSLLKERKQFKLYLTGNIAADAILHAKAVVMENNGITFELVEYPLSWLPISEQDFCILLGNLLDNAIEGVMCLPAAASSRHIKLAFSKVWDMLFITCINDADVSKIVQNGNSFVSTKSHPELHGFGIENMKRIVSETGGTIEFEVKNDTFSVEIMLGGKMTC